MSEDRPELAKYPAADLVRDKALLLHRLRKERERLLEGIAANARELRDAEGAYRAACDALTECPP